MTEQLLSDDELEHYRTAPKRITNPRARWVAKPGRHEQRNFEAVSEIDDRVRFRVYQRRNLDDERDFSCGLVLVGSGGRPLSLMRCNGANHRHGTIDFRCHVHRATAAAIARDGRPTTKPRGLTGIEPSMGRSRTWSGNAASSD